MIIKRNELACYVRERLELPPMLKEDFKCQKCYAQQACFLYNKLAEDGDGAELTKKAKVQYDELTQHLEPMDQEFMKKWDRLLTKEESDMMRFRRELWTMLSTEREKLGRCFSNVVLEMDSATERTDGSKIHRFNYTFVKHKPKPGFSFADSQLGLGEPVVVSDERGHFNLAIGFVTKVRRHRITVAVDRRLHNARSRLPGFDGQSNQTFAGIMEVHEGAAMPPQRTAEEPGLYRLDKDEFSNGMAAARNNLVQIMDDSVHKARDVRSLIVHGRAPSFQPSPSASAALASDSTQLAMNPDQEAAVEKVMSAQDYALVLGMPGTGKTTTVAHIIRALVARKKSVLLASYTHTAVDNILLKIRNDGIGILRLGASAKVHPEVKQFATLAVEPKGSLEELAASWMEPPVVATTCLGINHALFHRRTFDYCIVDEASQITLPVCLGPIRMARRFVLVGDHHQLPPLVQNRDAAAAGLDVSLFMLLCERHPEAVVSLEHQYRMSADIMHLSNTFIYSGRLKCGTPAVAERRLSIPNRGALAMHHRRAGDALHAAACPRAWAPSCWLARVLDPASAVVFLNTDAISRTLEVAAGARITNAVEARLVTQLTLTLLSVGIPAADIGIVAFYRSQLALLRASLQHAHAATQTSGPGGGAAAAVELHTADKFQGRDKDVILVSCVRSNGAGAVGDLLKDRRRVNVALTRARSKLVVVGSAATLAANPLLRDVVAECRAHRWWCDVLPPDVDAHLFDDGPELGPVARPRCARGGPRRAPRRGPQGGLQRQRQRQPPQGARRQGRGVQLHRVGVRRRRRRRAGAVRSRPARCGSRCPAGAARAKARKARSRSPTKKCAAGARAVLDGRPVLADVFRGAL